uniref:cDNA clone:002-105-G03, full insert sequence n=1 Tax=Oryza sativa subsp. japonica TaxID=39947 RepID=B7E9L2_ORYSJ|nr:unnamed protein product [Oryza sativa Japonica Group]
MLQMVFQRTEMSELVDSVLFTRASYLMDIQLLSKDLLWMQQYLISKVNCSL